jgi:hypothetical protein
MTPRITPRTGPPATATEPLPAVTDGARRLAALGRWSILAQPPRDRADLMLRVTG